MKLVTFEVATPCGPLQRLGVALAAGIVDLRTAYALVLQAEGEPPALAELLIPTDMTALLP